MTAFKLLRLLILKTIREERFLTFLSVLGVALGIGLFVGVKIASDRAMASFETDIRGPNPAVTHEVSGTAGIDFDERHYADVLALEEKSFPVIRVSGLVRNSGLTIDVQGLDLIKSLRFVRLHRGGPRELEMLIKQIDGVMVPRGLAEKLFLREGDRFHVAAYDREYTLTVVSVIDGPSVAPGTVIMDIGNFQEHFGRQGRISRIDVAADDLSAAALEQSLPQTLTLRKKETVVGTQKALVASFRHNLQFVSLIAILVGMFLLYNTVFVSVVKRRAEIGVLRGMGAGRMTVLALFSGQGILLGTAGSLLGLAVGQVSAYFSVAAVQRTMTAMYSTVSITEYLITPSEGLRAVALGICVSFAASVIPAFEASRVSPGESTCEGSFETRYRRRLGVFSALGLLLIAGGAALSLWEYLSVPLPFPYLSYGGILLIILGFTCLSPRYLAAALTAARRPVEGIFGAVGKLSLSEMQGSIYRFSIALMSVAISSALIVALVTLIHSFRHSLQRWIDSTILADVYIKPASCVSNYCFQPLSEEAVSFVEALPEVAGVDRYRVLRTEISGMQAIAAFGDAALTRRLAGPAFVQARNEARLTELEQGKSVAVSEYLAMKLGVTRGDTVEVATPTGRHLFTVSDTFTSYSTTSGFAYFDRKWLREYWGLTDATQLTVYLSEGQDAEAFIGRLGEQMSRDYSLDIMNNRELRQRIFGIFDRSFAITYAIEVIAIAVSLIGVVNILLALVLEKRREMSILRYLGAGWRQIEHKVVLSAGITGAAGSLLGFVMGLMMSLVFIHVVNKVSFGWEVSFRLPVLSLGLILLAVFLTTLCAAFIPAKVARSIDPKRFISHE